MSKIWKVAIFKDMSRPMLGGHAMHVACHGLPNVQVVALVDSNLAEIPAKLAATRAARHYATLEEMWPRESPDILIVCSRHPADHLPVIEAAARQGCHVYCEKPLAANLLEADKVLQVATTYGITIAMAHPARYAPAFVTLKAMLDAGEIGEPIFAQGRGKCDYRGGGEDTVVLGTHILDYLVWLFGRPQQVAGEVTRDGLAVTRADVLEMVEPIGPAAGDTVFARFGFEGGLRAHFESRRNMLVPGSQDTWMGIAITGTRGTLSLRLDDARSRPLLLSRRSCPAELDGDFEEVPLLPLPDVPGAQPLDYRLCHTADVPGAPLFLESNRLALYDLMESIEMGRRPVANIEDARTVVEMIQGIYASHLDGGRRMNLPLRNSEHPLAQPA